MKLTLSPDKTARLAQIIADLDALVDDLIDPRELDSPFHHGKLATARGDLAFVLESTRRHRNPLEVVVLEREAVTA